MNVVARASVSWLALAVLSSSCAAQVNEARSSDAGSPVPMIRPTVPQRAASIGELIERGSRIKSVEWVPDQASLEGAFLNDVVRFGSGLVAVGNDGGASGEPRYASTWTSRDGRTWLAGSRADADVFPTMVGLPGNGGLIAVATDGQRLVAVGGVGARGYGPDMMAAIWTSADGMHWKQATADPSFAGSFMLDVTTFGDGWVAVGVHEDASGEQRGAIWYSADGQAWRHVEVKLTGAADVVASVGIKLVLLTRDPDPHCMNCFGGGTHVFTSKDGLSWTQVADKDLPSGFGALGLEPVGDGLVTVGAAMMGNEEPVGNMLFETRDGEVWRQILPFPIVNGGVNNLIASPDGVFLAGGLVPPEDGCCAYPAFWDLRDDDWNAVLPDRQINEGSVGISGAAIAPNGSIVAVGSYEAQSADGISCCVIRGVVAIATPANS